MWKRAPCGAPCLVNHFSLLRALLIAPLYGPFLYYIFFITFMVLFLYRTIWTYGRFEYVLRFISFVSHDFPRLRIYHIFIHSTTQLLT